jgi:hypothetical protein
VPDYDYTRNIGVDHGAADASLVLTVYDDASVQPVARLRIPTEAIPDFIANVARHGTYALRDAAKRLEVGHCETCRNLGLIDVPHPHRGTERVACPDCRHRYPAEPFKNAPKIGDTRVAE